MLLKILQAWMLAQADCEPQMSLAQNMLQSITGLDKVSLASWPWHCDSTGCVEQDE